MASDKPCRSLEIRELIGSRWVRFQARKKLQVPCLEALPAQILRSRPIYWPETDTRLTAGICRIRRTPHPTTIFVDGNRASNDLCA